MGHSAGAPATASGSVSSSGGFGASVPLDVPPARGGLPIPVQISYGDRGVGAAGLGWHVPLSFLRRDITGARRRPINAPGVAPQGREQVSLVLDGQRIDLVRTATAWVARRDAPAIEVREQNDGTWLMFDGHGRTYRFAQVSSALAGTGMWLLQQVSGPGGNQVQLDYSITTPTLSGTPALTMDLVGVSYNSHPTTAGCFKNTVSLVYDNPASAPLSVSMLGATVLARMRKLVAVDVNSRESCGAAAVRLRRYQLSYGVDPDTSLPRLQSVDMLGRAGTPEATTALPIASYAYGSVTRAGALTYQLSQPQRMDNFGASRTESPPDSQFGTRYIADRALFDVTGDGRVDLVGFSSGQLFARPNKSSVQQIDFESGGPVTDNTLSARSIDLRTSRNIGGISNLTEEMVWRQMVDVNGDGRVDLVDVESGQWAIYLNTPDPATGRTQWVKRAYPTGALVQYLKSRGYTVNANQLPLARRRRMTDRPNVTCWFRFVSEWFQLTEEEQAASPDCDVYTDPLPGRTMTEWEIKDVNGDGYLDVVLNSSPIVAKLHLVYDERLTQTSGHASVVQIEELVPSAGSNNRIEAVFNVLGAHITSTEAFSTPVTLRNNEPCGVSLSVSEGPDWTLVCSIVDINGDSIVDRVNTASVMLGTGSLASGAFFTAGPVFTLPGELEVGTDNSWPRCFLPGAVAFQSYKTAGLQDLTGDGIADYVRDVGSGWTVAIGTGAGFGNPVPVNGVEFELSSVANACDGTTATTIDAVVDLNADGKADVVRDGFVYQLIGSDGARGAPAAGRLVQVGNGHGALTTVSYRSVKNDSNAHQVPFAQIVVDSVVTHGAHGLGGSLTAVRYAYDGAELVFDPAADAFTFPGYRRRIVIPTPVGQPEGVGTVTVIDTYAPTSPRDPYGLTTNPLLTREQRYALYMRRGRPRDITVLSGQFTASQLENPSDLILLDVDTDPRRIGATHHEWDARVLSLPGDPAGPEACTEMVYPYDEAASAAFAASHESYDGCIVRGLGFASSVQSWRGEPGAAPPSTASIETRTEVRDIDDLGRVLTAAHLNDVHRADDDLCVHTTYAEPTGTNERQLYAPTSHAVTSCQPVGAGAVTLASGRWEYDNLSIGSVSTGFPTAYTVERRDDTGALLDTIRTFDASFDAFGNPMSVTTTREDGASRTTTTAYDPFGVALVGTTVTATGVPAMQTTITRDPLTLHVLSVTDPNGTQHGATFDGFDREVLSTITPPGGTTGALSVTTYQGFTGSDSNGRRVEQKLFTDPVSPASAATAAGRTTKVYLDELGRPYQAEVALGADYQNELLIVGRRSYDGLGRVVFEADPHPATQSFSTAYGTTYFFQADGTLSCSVRGHGAQAAVPSATDESQELYPTCMQRLFQGHTQVINVRDAASFLAGSPQAGVTTSTYTTAIGRLLDRSTRQGGARLEHATFSHDRLGRLTGMTRYQNASAGSNPVTSSWRHDSLGQILQLDEPDSVPQLYTYSRWGELREVTRQIFQASQQEGGPPPPDSDLPPNQLRVINTYDALGRVIHREQRNGNDVIAETVSDYFYDQAVDAGPHVQPTHMLGRLALATSPTGSEAFSYDTFGRINARVFTDRQGDLYVEKHSFHGDGSPRTLAFLLPDAAFDPEQVTYQYDSAGRGKLTTYARSGSTQTLFEAQAIDPLGRVRQAEYGATTYTASYADLGRRLMNQAALSSPSGSRSISYQGYDPVGRERSRSEVKVTSGVSTGATTSWAYDPLGRLTSAVQTRGTTTVFNQQFTYDPLGNLVSLSDTAGTGGPTSTTLTYHGIDRDRICRIRHGGDTGTACNVTYDELGSIVVQPTPTGQRQYSYFADGSVRTITDTLGSAAQFRYDAFGQVQELDVTSSVSQDTRRDRRYGGLLTWREVTAGGTRTSVLSRKVPSPDGSVATRRGAGGPWVFEFGEARGNRFFVDQDGAFVQDVDYQPYGTATSTGAQPGSPLYSSEQWNGGDLLAAFGISQLGARLYDPAIGRFLSRDPLLIPRTAATTNPYAFAINDPVNYSDPSGLDHECPTVDSGLCVKEKGDSTTDNTHGGSHGDWRPISGLDIDLPGETPGDPDHLVGHKVPIVAGYAAAGQLFPEAVAGAAGAGAAGATTAGAAAAGGAALGGAMVAGVLIGSAILAVAVAIALPQVLPLPEGVGYPRCGDYNAHCWNDYIRRVTQEQKRRDPNGFTTFYHGTTKTAAQNILSDGLKPVSMHTYPYPPGSLFTHEASNVQALIAASHWPVVSRKAVSNDVRIVHIRVPNSLVAVLRAAQLMKVSAVSGVYGFPDQTVFLPGALPFLNASATILVGPPLP